MIADLKPYPAMKDSGVPWLGKVPEHWEVRRTRNAVDMRVSNIDKHTNEGELPVRLCNYVDVYKNDRITERVSFMRATAMPEEMERFRLEPGDVLITKDSEAWNDIGVPAMVEYTAEDLVCGYHLALLRPRRELLNGAYLLRALQSPAVTYQFHVAANGVTRYGLSHDAIKSVLLPLPPVPEQAAIVRFLDHADGRIRRYIRAKQKQIKLLEEQKQAIIHRAVTRGFDPNVRLKPSGVEWLGDVPEHWEVRRLKSLLAAPISDGPHTTPAFLAEGVPFLSVDGIQGGELVFERCRFVSPSDHAEFRRKTAPRRDDILLGKAASTGKIARVKVDFEFSIWSPLALIRPDTLKVMSSFLEYALKDVSAQSQLEMLCTFNTQKNISMDDIPKLVLPLPPLVEQAAIVRKVGDATAKPNRALATAVREISLLREYRTRLIADLVTGKLDVREAAARLPDSIEKLEPLDEAAALADAKEGAADDLDAVPEEPEA